MGERILSILTRSIVSLLQKDEAGLLPLTTHQSHLKMNHRSSYELKALMVLEENTEINYNDLRLGNSFLGFLSVGYDKRKKLIILT